MEILIIFAICLLHPLVSSCGSAVISASPRLNFQRGLNPKSMWNVVLPKLPSLTSSSVFLFHALSEVFFSLNDCNKIKRNLFSFKKKGKTCFWRSGTLVLCHALLPKRGTLFSFSVHMLCLVCISKTPYKCVMLKPTLVFDFICLKQS